ncbi:MAG: DUF1311 domain-containing protein [Acidobacteriota bacterium]|nr:DUF1311 domain-containing protein [Acidobacteriota bacterium]
MNLLPLAAAFILISPCTESLAQHMNAPVPCNQPTTTSEEAACFANDLNTADKEMNRLYAQARTVLDPGEKNDLLQAQRAWLKYRDLTCTAEFNLYGGGTGGPVTKYACLAALTHERVATLKTTYGWRLEK